MANGKKVITKLPAGTPGALWGRFEASSEKRGQTEEKVPLVVCYSSGLTASVCSGRTWRRQTT